MGFMQVWLTNNTHQQIAINFAYGLNICFSNISPAPYIGLAAGQTLVNNLSFMRCADRKALGVSRHFGTRRCMVQNT